MKGESEEKKLGRDLKGKDLTRVGEGEGGKNMFEKATRKQ